jgi:hypothetical protein
MYTYFISFTSLFLSVFLCLSLLSLLSVQWNVHMRLCLAFLLFLIRVWQDSCMIGFEGVGVNESGMLILSFFLLFFSLFSSTSKFVLSDGDRFRGMEI